MSTVPARRAPRRATLAVVAVLLGVLGWFIRPPPRPAARPGTPLGAGALVVWSPGYRVSFFGVERLHPFQLDKGAAAAEALVAAGLAQPSELARPGPIEDGLLEAVHDESYLAALHGAGALGAALELELPAWLPAGPLERRVLGPFQRQVQGTLVAARGALEHGLGINLGGGFHHARPNMGHGFCIYSDVAAAIHRLRAEGLEGTVLIVDTDAHQGDGSHAFFADDPTVFSLSLHQGNIFPEPKLAGDLDRPLAGGTTGAALLAALEQALAEAPQDPVLVIHVAGADVLRDDPLAGLDLGVEDLVARDALVQRWAQERGAALLHLLAGGYGPSAGPAQAASVVELVRAHRPLDGRGTAPTR